MFLQLTSCFFSFAPASEDDSVAVRVLPGTELSFAGEVATLPAGLLRWRDRVIKT